MSLFVRASVGRSDGLSLFPKAGSFIPMLLSEHVTISKLELNMNRINLYVYTEKLGIFFKHS